VSLINSLPQVKSIKQHKTTITKPLTPYHARQNTASLFAREILFVATNLDSWEADDIRYGQEVLLDLCYRQLDASYYAWLRNKMNDIKQAHDSGKLAPHLYEQLRARFNTIHDWAIRNIGETNLRKAMAATDTKSYTPPSETTYAAYRKAYDEAWNAGQGHLGGQSGSTPNSAARLDYYLTTRGWAAIQSAIAGDTIIIARDELVVVPDQWSQNVCFTLDEVKMMLGSEPEAIKRIWEIKKMFGGEVVPADDYPFEDDKPRMHQQSLFPVGMA